MYVLVELITEMNNLSIKNLRDPYLSLFLPSSRVSDQSFHLKFVL